MKDQNTTGENTGQQSEAAASIPNYGSEITSSPGMAPITISPEAPSIQLPKGGGAIKGMGEKFEANAVTGTASFSIPVLLTANPRGMSPSLALSYNSGAGNSAFGLGWNVGAPSISRKTGKGLPRYREVYDAEVEMRFDEREVLQEADTFVLAGAEDLVPKLNTNGTRVQRNENIGATIYTVYDYIPRVEGAFMKIERWHAGVNNTSFWKVIDRNNITSIFGQSVYAIENAPGNYAKILTWHLEKRYDALGNVMVFDYKREDTVGVNAPFEASRKTQNWNHAKKYLNEVWYGNDVMYNAANPPTLNRDDFRFCLAVNYGQWTGDNPDLENPNSSWVVRQDPFSDYRGGFEIRTWRLCQSIDLYHRFAELGSGWTLTARTLLQHDENPIASTLTQVIHRMYEGSTWEEYPPIDLDYSKAELGTTLQYMEASDLRNLPGGTDGQRYRWTDLYGEGLTGVLCESPQAWYYKRNIAPIIDETTGKPKGHLANQHTVLSKPKAASTDSQLSLEDVDGDGLLEAVYESAALNGFYRQKNGPLAKSGDWLAMQNFEAYPTLSQGMRKIDLTGNGYADLLLIAGETLIWHPSMGKRGYAPALRKQLDSREGQAPKVVFSGGEENIYLADMSGDGLSDICRVRNGAIDYWPNLGYGNFGARVAMHVAGGFAPAKTFDPSRIRLSDTDGSGTTDILYIGKDQTVLYLNQSGNAFAAGEAIAAFPRIDNAATVSTADVLANGTACLVWSSPLAAAQGKHLAYLPLMNNGKPYLLTSIDNNRGALQSLEYKPSSWFYLNDELAGKPWITKLPFIVHCLYKSSSSDLISKLVQVQRYAYHHGYFDPQEREFRGFGMVEQWDTDLEPNATGQLELLEGETSLAIAPIHTKSWFHNGYFSGRDELLAFFADEYYQGDASAVSLPKTVLPANLSGKELREALYTMKGSLLRQEVYADDDSPEAAIPYTVSENRYEVIRVQEGNTLPYGVFRLQQAESISFQYERNAADPRISRSFVLEDDAYGNITKALTVALPRRGSGHAAQQTVVLGILAETDYINHPFSGTGADAFLRLGVPEAQRQYEVHGLNGTVTESSNRETLITQIAAAPKIAHTASPGTGLKLRLIGESMNSYYAQNLSAALPAGQVAAHGLPYTGKTLAYTDALRNQLFGSKVSGSDLIAAGFSQNGTDYYAETGRLVFDATAFFLPTTQIDPKGNSTSIAYDSYKLLPLSITDALGNSTSSIYAYRLLQPEEVTDANGNRQKVAFDVLGRPAKMWRKGKTSENLGDSDALPGTLFTYAFYDALNAVPNKVFTQQREAHADANARILESHTYSDGLERVLLEKVMAEPEQGSSTPRWVGSGRVVLNNKGWPVRQYEPYFASTPDYEAEASQRSNGVSAILSYDPLGRAIRTDMPDGTFSKVEFSPWKQQDFDANDTVIDSQWYADRGSPNAGGAEPTDADERAAWLAAQHYNTPKISHFDTLGRAFLVQDDNGSFDGSSTTHDYIDTQTHFDITGRRTGYTNALGQTTNFAYAIHARNSEDEQGQAQPASFDYTDSSDKGSQWMLNDLMGLPHKRWDSRNHTFRYSYDALNRPTESFVDDGNGEKMIEKRIYGEAQGASLNHMGQLYELFDQSGKMRVDAYDFKGNLLQNSKTFATDYKNTLDWNASPGLETETFSESINYDALDRPTQQTKADGSICQYTYNKAGLLETVKVKAAHEASFSTQVSNINYNEKGQRTDIYYGNNSKTKYTYDPNSFRLTRLLTTRNNGADILQDLNYTYDPVGNITEQSDDAQQTHYFNNTVIEPRGKYTYDALYRLLKGSGREKTGISAPSPGGLSPDMIPTNGQSGSTLSNYCQQFTYDAMGNLLQLSHRSSCGGAEQWKRTYLYNAGMPNNYLQKAYTGATPPTNPEFTYDAHGNMLQMPHLQSMAWDMYDQLQRTDKTDESTYYVYSGGERVRKVVLDTSGTIDKIKYERIYLGAYELYREYDASENLKTERKTLHVLDDKRIVSLLEIKTVDNGTTIPLASQSTKTRFQYTNHLDSASLELNKIAEIISYEEYHPFGTTSYSIHTNDSEVSLKRYRYVHKERDEETGLYYYGARYYAPWLCRFVSVDPLKDDYPFYTSYQYAGNRPIIGIDRDGLELASPLSIARKEYPITMGILEGTEEIATDTWTFFSKDIWKSETWINTGNFLLDMADPYPNQTKIAIAQNIVDAAQEVPDWGAYEWSKSITKLTVGTATSIIGDKGLSKLKNLKYLENIKSLKGLKFVDLPHTGKINPNEILFPQASIKNTFKDGISVKKLIDDLNMGNINPDDIPPIRIVEFDGKVFTLDNRRLHAYQQAGLEINYEKLDFIPDNEKFKFKDYLSGKTDGTAIKIRGENN